METQTRQITMDKEGIERYIREYGDKATSWATKSWISLVNLSAFTFGRYYDSAREITNPDSLSYSFWTLASLAGITALTQYVKNAGLRDHYKKMLGRNF
jgi:hypothetical protein